MGGVETRSSVRPGIPRSVGDPSPSDEKDHLDLLKHRLLPLISPTYFSSSPLPLSCPLRLSAPVLYVVAFPSLTVRASSSPVFPHPTPTWGLGSSLEVPGVPEEVTDRVGLLGPIVWIVTDEKIFPSES